MINLQHDSKSLDYVYMENKPVLPNPPETLSEIIKEIEGATGEILRVTKEEEKKAIEGLYGKPDATNGEDDAEEVSKEMWGD
jgi:hypothetical protein